MEYLEVTLPDNTGTQHIGKKTVYGEELTFTVERENLNAVHVFIAGRTVFFPCTFVVTFPHRIALLDREAFYALYKLVWEKWPSYGY